MKTINSFIKFILDLYINRRLISQLTKRDFKARYLGSYLGLIWAFIHPCVMIGLFWFVFHVGFRVKSASSEYPFILWFISGIIPWFFIVDGLSTATSSVIEHSYLVKKVVFRVSLLPVVKILSALIIHLFFIFLIFVMFAVHGFYPLPINFQCIYYLFCSCVLLLGIGWLTSSLVVFFKDISQIIAVVIQIGFWITPIFWTIDRIPVRYRFIFKLNPFFYITEGYRKSFISHQWFWQDWLWTLYFWLFAGAVFLIGATVFRKLRPHFADVI